MKAHDDFKQGLIDGIPSGLAYVAVSFAFGISGVSKGIPVWAVTLISATCLTSAGQFAAIISMTAGGSVVELILSQIIINLRYSIMSNCQRDSSWSVKKCSGNCNLWNADWNHYPAGKDRQEDRGGYFDFYGSQSGFPFCGCIIFCIQWFCYYHLYPDCGGHRSCFISCRRGGSA